MSTFCEGFLISRSDEMDHKSHLTGQWLKKELKNLEFYANIIKDFPNIKLSLERKKF